MRIDINAPIDPGTDKIADDRRIKIHSHYIKRVINEYAPALVLGSHQGRPGGYEFIALEQHAELLARYSGLDVRYVEDVIGPTAREEIRKLRPREVLLLDNLRFVSEEILEVPPEKQAFTIMVKKLSPLFEAYINDAFATAHRSQPSIVGIPLSLPSAIGLLFEKELDALRKTMTPQNIQRIFILGGKKVAETLRVIENLTRNKLAERILTTGLLAQLFLVAKGIDIGIENIRVLEENGILPLVPRARYILMRGAPIETPLDFVVRVNNNVKNLHVGELKGGVIKDIGENTINIYIGSLSGRQK
ncbi:MAG: phosphoglycerate kinase [Desulfurococcaceae archaeon]